MSQEAAGSNGKLLAGRMLCAGGIVLALVGAYFVSIALGVLGMVLGVTGYALGAWNFGRVTIVFCVATILIGILIGQGIIPGYDGMIDSMMGRIRNI